METLLGPHLASATMNLLHKLLSKPVQGVLVAFSLEECETGSAKLSGATWLSKPKIPPPSFFQL